MMTTFRMSLRRKGGLSEDLREQRHRQTFRAGVPPNQKGGESAGGTDGHHVHRKEIKIGPTAMPVVSESSLDDDA
jgi:hypothetical protein